MTRKSYQRYLKSRGLTDDVSTKELMAMTMNTGYRERVKEEKIRTLVDNTFRGFRFGQAPCRTEAQHQLKHRLERLLRR